ncbi:DUF2604 domain-containing protein [Flavisolibacter ginsengisoli]|jgi:hypothetical protein|uniref:Ubiquitin-like domain-containing protein n=1 Tax=Flavisolibacter ginsengisoli DSM 18119 TaxID=1121884 RepID=A0A1M5BCA7_9BACT|nr:DUF2604 domain-containing protein [Flavisolibacter ginsengisoli]SHF40006.1 Protein of Unknown function [Flavisolibacter ginsengisoli DSM 18119]
MNEHVHNNAPDQGVSNSGNGGGSGHPNQITVNIRYQSETVQVTINQNESINALLEQAIKATENNSVDKDRLQLKLGGTVLDLKNKVSDYAIQEGVTLVLSLTAGGGGNYSL